MPKPEPQVSAVRNWLSKAIDADRTYYEDYIKKTVSIADMNIESLTVGRKAESVSAVGCSFLTDVKLGRNVKRLTLTGASRLTNITVPAKCALGVGAFERCVSLTTVNLPDTLSELPSNAFARCRSLVSLDLPEGCNRFGSYSFSGCPQLVSIGNPRPADIPTGLFSHDISLPLDSWEVNGDGNIGDYAFDMCISIPGMSIVGASEYTVGYYAFRNCINLSSFSTDNQITAIKDNAFHGCVNLTSLGDNAQGLSSVGENAFSHCLSLTDVSFAYGATIGKGAFSYCTAMSEFNMSDANVSVADEAFVGCANLSKVTIPDSVVLIGSSSFRQCLSLPSVSATQVTEVRSEAFSDCLSLTEAVLPSCTKIAAHAFSDCAKLSEISTSTSDAVSIGSYAFSGCTSLLGSTLTHVKSCGDYAFNEAYKISLLFHNFESVGVGAFRRCVSQGGFLQVDGGDIVFERCVSVGSIDYVKPKNLLNVSVKDCHRLKRFYSSDDTFDTSSTAGVVSSSGSNKYADFSNAYNLENITLKGAYTQSGGGLRDCFSLLVAPKTVYDSLRYSGSDIDRNTAVLQGCDRLDTANLVAGYNTLYIDLSGCRRLKTLSLDAPGRSTYGHDLCTIDFRGCDSLSHLLVSDRCKASFDNLYSLEALPYADGEVSHTCIVESPDSSYRNCYSLSCDLPSSFNVSDYMFANCHSLTVATGLSVGNRGFFGCTQLETADVAAVSEGSFAECPRLHKATIGRELSVSFKIDEFGAIWDDSIVTHESTIGVSAFYGCSSLEEVVIRSGVSRIAPDAFVGCTNLKKIYIQRPLPVFGLEFSAYLTGYPWGAPTWPEVIYEDVDVEPTYTLRRRIPLEVF